MGNGDGLRLVIFLSALLLAVTLLLNGQQQDSVRIRIEINYDSLGTED